MESGLIPLNLTAAVIFFLIFIFIFIKKQKKSKSLSAKLPPGPYKPPIIGNLHHIISAHPFRSFRDLAKQHGPIMHLMLGEVPVIIVSSPEIAKQILKDNNPNFANRPGNNAIKIIMYNNSDVSFSPYGNYWRQMRKICLTELLSAKNVCSFTFFRNDKVSRLVESIRLCSGLKQPPLNLTEKVFSLTSSITCRAAFGKVCKDRDALVVLLKEVVQMACGLTIGDLFPSSKIVNTLSWSKLRLLMMRPKLDVIVDDIINEHKENLAKMERENGEDDSGNRRSGNGEFGNEDL